MAKKKRKLKPLEIKEKTCENQDAYDNEFERQEAEWFRNNCVGDRGDY